MFYVKKILVVGMILFLLGCKTVLIGKDFEIPKGDLLKLGETRAQDIYKLYGISGSTRTVIINGERIQGIGYQYLDNTKDAFSGIIRQKELTFWFANQILVGKEYISSFSEDSTEFKSEKAKSIKQGMTRDEIVKIMGLPNGEFWKFVRRKGNTLIVYKYKQLNGKGPILSQLSVELDQKNIAVDVTYSENLNGEYAND